MRRIKEEIRGIRSELKGDMSSLKSELKSDIHAMEERLTRRIESLEKRIDTVQETTFFLYTGKKIDQLSSLEARENRG